MGMRFNAFGRYYYSITVGFNVDDMKKIIIDVFRAVGWDSSALIVSHPTGVFYDVQVGGVACNHPEIEGFCIDMGQIGSHINDCSYGCHHIPDMPEQQLGLANAINDYLVEYSKDWTFQISFDFDRLKELQEAWWPVTVFGKMDDLEIDWKGYLHTGNCD